jgi:hypothetical protein
MVDLVDLIAWLLSSGGLRRTKLWGGQETGESQNVGARGKEKGKGSGGSVVACCGNSHEMMHGLPASLKLEIFAHGNKQTCFLDLDNMAARHIPLISTKQWSGVKSCLNESTAYRVTFGGKLVMQVKCAFVCSTQLELS